ncbi:MAG: peroxiredoxin [Deltaproteobacteria bacterium]|nr:MAG: peroxiredoxin [Deltaproteobacteria bacterium]
MAKKLGIFVSSDRHLDKLIHLCRAARNRGDVEVTIFFSHLGTLLTQDPRFGELEGLAKMSLCNVGFESHGLKKPVPGIGDKDYATQARHGDLIEESDRYLVF